jgi:lauroyl/myristoyl acyltransferase
MARFLLYKAGQFIVNILPLRWAYGFAQIFSDLQYAFSVEDRRNVRSNIKIILKQDQIDERLVRDVFRNFGRYLVDFFRMVRYLNQDYIKKNIKDEGNGLEHIREVLKRGKGAVIITAHIGNWELGGVLLAKFGIPILAVALPHKHKWVNGLFNAQREQSGMPVVPPSIAVRRCLEKLRANEAIALVADRDFGPHGLEMDFLGRRTLLPKGPAVLALKTGAGIVPTFLIRTSTGKFTMSFAKPVYPPFVDDQTVVGDEVLRGIINQYIPVIEDKIRQHPSQWLMFREFWVK